MDNSFSNSSTVFRSFIILLNFTGGVFGATFSFVNRCDFTIWPGILANSGSPTLGTTGFELPKDTSRSVQAPTGWSGRFWARTGCNFDGSASGFCSTADCGSGQVECNGLGAVPPVTLTEFTLGTVGLDFYDVSLVDGYNLPVIVEGSGGSGACATTGCVSDLNLQCPTELKTGNGGACRSACEAFRSPEYCCSGAYSTPDTCRPSVYSEIFKAACPRSYSYAYDDATSTFTCTGGDYTVTFCPSSTSKKSSSYSATPATEVDTSQGSVSGNSDPKNGYPGSVSGSGSTETLVADGSWLAGLAMGDASREGGTSSSIAILVLLVFFLINTVVYI